MKDKPDIIQSDIKIHISERCIKVYRVVFSGKRAIFAIPIEYAIQGGFNNGDFIEPINENGVLILRPLTLIEKTGEKSE